MKNSRYLVIDLTVVLLFTLIPINAVDVRCSDSRDTCGHRDLSEQLVKGALYSCSGNGSVPILKSQCRFNNCIHPEDGRPDYCAVSQNESSVRCSDSKDTCGYRDLSGHLEKAALYSCSGNGSVPILKNNCPNNNCIHPEDGKPDYCAVSQNESSVRCSDSKDTCGQRDLSGHLVKGALYRCSGSGSVPILITQCPNNNCIHPEDGKPDYCAEKQTENCTCKRGTGDFCGQRTAPYLTGNCVSGTLYHCTGAEIPANVKSECSDHNCTTLGDGGADYCAGHEIQNNCICSHGNGDFCGQRTAPYLTGSCVLGALYHCSGMGLTAKLKDYCPNNVCRDNVAPGTDFCAGFI